MRQIKEIVAKHGLLLDAPLVDSIIHFCAELGPGYYEYFIFIILKQLFLFESYSR